MGITEPYRITSLKSAYLHVILVEDVNKSVEVQEARGKPVRVSRGLKADIQTVQIADCELDLGMQSINVEKRCNICLLYTSPSPRD